MSSIHLNRYDPNNNSAVSVTAAHVVSPRTTLLNVPSTFKSKSSSSAISCNLPAIRVRNLNVTYRSSSTSVGYVLNGVRMTVPKGSIYGLLGPSGCGKTTMLKCLMGLKTFDSGEVGIFGYPVGARESGIPGPGVGYMPQEIGLSRDLSISETLAYFGSINFLTKKEITEKTGQLINLLELPEPTTLIANLSGGQLRRVSFACTILHNPRLLILDEPTVGVDPLLRTRIWQQLVHFTRLKGITVIVTTHYIEETRKADIVGFMRKGAIIAESSPGRLMTKYNVTSLEGVFHRLCYIHKRQSLSFIHYENPEDHIHCPESAVSPAPLVTSNRAGSAWWLQFKAVMTKYYIQITRQPETIIASFVLPIIVLLVFCVCVGGTPNGVPLGLVNKEVCDPQSEYGGCLSHIFLSEINNYVFRKITYTDLSEAIEDAEAGRIWGVVTIEKGFTEALQARLAFSEEDWTGKPVNLNSSLIQVHGDLTGIVLARLVTGSLLNVYQRTIVSAVPYNPRLADLPIELGQTVFGSFGKSDFFGVRDFAAPGLTIVIVYTISFALTAFTLLLEKSDKTLDRAYVAGLNRSHIIFGQLVTRFAFLIAPVIILLTLAVTLFDLPCHGSFIAAIALLLLQTLNGMSLGVFLSAVSPSIFACCIIANGVLLFTFILSGVMWSIDTLPYYLRWVSAMQPTTAASEAFRSILVRGLPVTQTQVAMGFIVSIIWTVVWLALGTIAFSFK